MFRLRVTIPKLGETFGLLYLDDGSWRGRPRMLREVQRLAGCDGKFKPMTPKQAAAAEYVTYRLLRDCKHIEIELIHGAPQGYDTFGFHRR
ncbi:hypothetical protein [Aeoliella sp.]|uniref:hypothetical protein n=1 Tax=Aeoliella sp. TaxID=2795800 RepID=UPI003CCC2A21